tara:strand:+ start:294 stop:770 length:477 start_codon:yes stop_codon:yes gene_type:complete
LEKRKSEKLNSNPSDSISLSKIGSFIKEARNNKNQSIEELAKSLKISEYQLKAIEDGREDLLPEKVFVNAMVRRISEKLKLDHNIMMGELSETTSTETTNKSAEENKEDNKIKKTSPIVFLSLVMMSGLIGLISSSFILNIFTNIQNESLEERVQKNI